MSLLDLIPESCRATAVIGFGLVAVCCSGLLAWQIQAWRYGQQLEHQARLHADTLNELTLAGATLQRSEQDKRIALEQRLRVSEQAHYSELADAEKNQKLLRSRLATSDLRLSVVLAASGPGSGPVSAPSGAGGMDPGARRAELDPAHAQRIIDITGDGDRGLIALKACQAYAREVSSPK